MSLCRRLLIPGLILGAIVRGLALPLPGTGDVGVWKVWSFAGAHDLTGVYGVGGSPPERRLLQWQGNEMTVDYPPISVAELSLAGRLYEWRDPLYEDSAELNAAVKLPGLLAEILLVGAALTWGRRRFGDDAAAWVALALWLNPAFILDGPVLGYLDAQMAAPAVLALAAAWAGFGWLAGALAAFAVLTKAQAIFVVPAITATLIWRHAKKGWRAPLLSAAGATVISAVALFPYVARGAWTNLTQGVGRLATHDMLSAQAANVWWILTWVLRVQDVASEWGWWRALTQEVRILGITRAVALGVPNPRVVGVILVSLACGWAAWRLRGARSLAATAALAGWSAYAYALFAAQVHENHLYLALPFFAVAAGIERRYRPLFWSVSAIFTLNLLLFYGLGRGMPSLVERGWTGIDASVLLACVNVVVFMKTTSGAVLQDT